jgi:trimeric autotransporter adhesin
MKKLLLLSFLISSMSLLAQVGINTTTPAAQLDIKSSNQATPANTDGLLIPKIDTFPATNPTVAQQGMLVNLTTATVFAGNPKPAGFYYWDNATTNWISFAGTNTTGWTTTGNTGTVDGTNFIGTTDNVPLSFKVNNIQAGRIEGTTTYNTFLGQNSGGSNTTGFENAAFGINSMAVNTTGFRNNAFGADALTSNTTGSSNTAFGVASLFYNTTGYRNAAFGDSTLGLNTTGFRNTAIGANSLVSNTTGNYNTAIGNLSLAYNLTASNNTASGYGALYLNTASDNTANGFQALNLNITGTFNTAVGSQSLLNNDSGSYNSSNGYQSLYTNDTGYYNTAMGAASLFNNIGGNYNNAFGVNALYSNTSGSSNAAFGDFAFQNNTTGSANVAVGSYALNFNSSANLNNAVGVEALYLNTTGTHNVAVGSRALYNNSTGDNNTSIGNEAGFISGFSNLSNTVTVGYNSVTNTPGLALLGNTATSFCGGYTNWFNFSDGRFKTNVKENVAGLEFIKALRPVTYTVDIHKLDKFIYKDKAAEYEKNLESFIEEKNNKVETGFIAQEVEAAAKKLGYDFDGVNIPKDPTISHYTLSYASFVVPLVKAVQEQQEIIDIQNQKIKLLEDTNVEILKRLEKLENK